MRRWAAVVAGILLVGPAMSGCGGDVLSHGSGSTPPATSATPTVSSTPYVVVPSDVATTAPGTNLPLGQAATVGWKAPQAGVTGVLGITVTAVQRTSFDAPAFDGWQKTGKTLSTTPYFVHATVRNAGDSDLGGFRVPLYALDARNELVEASTFSRPFKPCSPAAFPKRFPAGASVDVCLVYLVPQQGKLVGVSYRPDESLAAITWTGPVQQPGKTKSHGPVKKS